MKAKEKAQELCSKFIDTIPDDSEIHPKDALLMAKQCALIAVDEIINALLSESLKRGHMNSMLPFYEEVKREIGLL